MVEPLVPDRPHHALLAAQAGAGRREVLRRRRLTWVGYMMCFEADWRAYIYYGARVP